MCNIENTLLLIALKICIHIVQQINSYHIAVYANIGHYSCKAIGWETGGAAAPLAPPLPASLYSPYHELLLPILLHTYHHAHYS